MIWFYLVLTGVLASPIIYWLSQWTPHHIEVQEASWVSQLTGKTIKTTYSAPPPLWRVAFWQQAIRSTLFWISVFGAIAVTVVFGHQFAKTTMLAGLICFGLVILCLAVTDAHSQLLPDSMTLTLMWAGMLAQLSPATQTVGIDAAVVGAATGYLLLWTVARLFAMLRKQEGLGYGDMKLMAAAGAWLGPLALPGAIVIGSALAVLFHGLRIAIGKSKKDDLFAFGPWLATGILLAAILF